MKQLKPCPFCGREMVFYKDVYTNKFGKRITEKYYMHEDAPPGEGGCILDEICMPFVIGAGDATEDYIGEYAEKWNKRAYEKDC